MSKEQKTLKSCYILDRLREWFELYGNQNRQRAEEEWHLAIDELYEYQQKDRQLADLEAKLAESEEKCKKAYQEGLLQKQFDKDMEIEQLKQQLAEKKKENLTLFSMLYETLEKQGCENITSSIEQMTNLTLEKQSDWFKENCVKDQDKISFAIAELEKVKSAFGLINSKLDKVETIKEYIHYIDHQINELKGK